MSLFAALLGAVFSSSKDLVSKRLSLRVDGTVSAFASFLYSLPFYVVLLALLYGLGFEGFAVSGSFLLLVGLRASTDAVAEAFKMHAFGQGDVSVVSCFLSLSPLYLLFLSPLVTGDPITAYGIAAIVLVVAGSLLLAYRPRRTTRADGVAESPPAKASGYEEKSVPANRPAAAAQQVDSSAAATDKTEPANSRPPTGITGRGILFGLAASFFFALNTCFDRLAVQQASPVLSGFAMTLLAAALLLPIVLSRRNRIAQLRGHAGSFWLRGFFEIAYMVSKLYALQFLYVPHVVAIGKLALPLSIIGGRLFFKEGDLPRRLAAGLLILAGVVVIVFELAGR